MPDKEAVVDEARNLMEEQKYAEALDMMRGLVEALPDDARSSVALWRSADRLRTTESRRLAARPCDARS